jgi:hypothetical protein
VALAPPGRQRSRRRDSGALLDRRRGAHRAVSPRPGCPLRGCAVSLLAVIAIPPASAATYIRRSAANLHLGLTLEVLTIIRAPSVACRLASANG